MEVSKMSYSQQKQVLRRKRVKEHTLIMGVDVGKEFDSIVLMNYRGEVLKKISRVYNSYAGYEWLKGEVGAVQRRGRFGEVLMGLEPTGHYWRKVSKWAQGKGMKVVFVKTSAVKYQRGLDQSSRAKSDVRDAVVIGNLVREGKYCDTEIKDDTYQELRRVVKYRERVLRSFGGAQNRLVGWLDDYFPELKGLFSQTKAKGLRALLRECPTVEAVKRRSVDELARIVGRASRRKGKAYEKVKEIRQCAFKSIGLGDVKRSDMVRLQLILDDLDYYERQLKVLVKEMSRLVKETEYGDYVLSVKGVGVVMAAIFLGEVGDPGNFRRAKELISYSGLDPYETESGLMYGRRKISKEGRFLLRANLYRMAISMVNHNGAMRAYYEKKLKGSGKERSLHKKEALCTVAIKLVKLLFALIRDKRMYKEEAAEYQGIKVV
jgi:transposase